MILSSTHQVLCGVALPSSLVLSMRSKDGTELNPSHLYDIDHFSNIQEVNRVSFTWTIHEALYFLIGGSRGYCNVSQFAISALQLISAWIMNSCIVFRMNHHAILFIKK